MYFDAKLLLAATALSSLVPIVAFATGEIVVAYVLGPIVVGTFIAVGASLRSRHATAQLEQFDRRPDGGPKRGTHQHH